MPTVGSYTVTRGPAALLPDGTLNVMLVYTNAAGVVVHQREMIVAADRSQIVDQYGNVVATPSPSGLNTAIANFASALDSAIASGAAGGKLNL